MSEQQLRETLLELAGPRMSADALLKAVKRRYPKAKKKDIIHAAFSAIIAVADNDLERALVLQNFAVKQRGGEDE